jgi:hypothetical protein
MPFPFPLLLCHALVLDISILSEELVESKTPLLVRIRVLSPCARIPTFLAGLEWVHPEVFPRQECSSWVQKVMVAVAIVI